MQARYQLDGESGERKISRSTDIQAEGETGDESFFGSRPTEGSPKGRSNVEREIFHSPAAFGAGTKSIGSGYQAKCRQRKA